MVLVKRMHDFLTNTTPSARLRSLRGILTSRSHPSSAEEGSRAYTNGHALTRNFEDQRLPSSAEEGWLREVRMPRSDLSRADGVVLVRKSCILFTNTTPSAPSEVATRFFLMSRPPLLS